jgi:Flp pilus assembly protein TadG
MLRDNPAMRHQKSLMLINRMASALRRYARNERGVTAIEFALVAAPFLYLLVGILEVSAMFVANVMLDHGSTEASRRVRTLELQSAGGSASDFKKLVCDSTFGILDCAGKMYVDVETYNNFGDVTQNPPIKNGSLDQAQLNFVPGGSGSIVVAKVYYEWPIMTPFFGALWSNLGGNKRLLQSTVAFRNEP